MSVAYIAPVDAFALELAAFLLESYTHLPEVILFLPSQRARRAMKEALLVANDGKALLMPRMFPLADADLELLIPEALHAETHTLPGVIGDMTRVMRLARLIEARTGDGKAPLSAEETFHLAESFAKLSDDFAREQKPLSVLEELVPEELAEHWQASLALLSTITEEWPALMETEGRVDTLTRRNMEMALLAHSWRKNPPATPVIAAGTTGSIPATAQLLNVIKDLPQGLVVLPGLDCHMPEAEWNVLKPSHPQYGLKHVLEELKLTRDEVASLRVNHPEAERTKFLRSVMAPPEYTGSWKQAVFDWPAALENITLVQCHDEHEEAGVISLMLRHVLEAKKLTAMLVTHDRVLARQVSAMMRRYGVDIDDSAGVPLTDTPPFVFFHHIADYALNDGDPLSLLALLKHPMLRMGQDSIKVREGARYLEVKVLRGTRKWNHWQELEERVCAKITDNDDACDVLRGLHRAMKPLFDMLKEPFVSFNEMLATHRSLAEELSLPDGMAHSEEGRELLTCLDVLRQEGHAYGAINPREYFGVVSLLLAGKTYRRPYNLHPRLRILSPLEARMQQADHVIMGGLNEGSWPPAPVVDPWLSLPMREQAGLKSHAHQVGLAAHDFWMLAHAPNLFITRATKQRATPTTPSRWLLRLETLLEAAPKSIQFEFRQKGDEWLFWQHALSEVESVPASLRPAPRPEVTHRPKSLPVTRIKTLLEDPYSVYAERILRLKPQEPIDKLPDHAEFGDAVHKALYRFFVEYPQMPDHAEGTLYVYLSEEIRKILAHNRASLFWEQRLRFIAKRTTELATEQRDYTSVALEKEIEWLCAGVRLLGRIDRREESAGGVYIIDYKTGTPPSISDILHGKDPQLGLFGLMVANQENKIIRKLSIWPLKGRAADEKMVGVEDEEKITALLGETQQGVTHLLEMFNSAATPYISLADQQQYEGDYDHLARKGEWA